MRYPQSHRARVVARDGAGCSTCDETCEDLLRPIELAHRIPFKVGVVDWGLTPDWLDGVDNLCLAHRGACNDRAELVADAIPARLRHLGLSVENSPAVASGMLIVTMTAGAEVVEFRTGVTSGSQK